MGFLMKEKTRSCAWMSSSGEVSVLGSSTSTTICGELVAKSCRVTAMELGSPIVPTLTSNAVSPVFSVSTSGSML